LAVLCLKANSIMLDCPVLSKQLILILNFPILQLLHSEENIRLALLRCLKSNFQWFA